MNQNALPFEKRRLFSGGDPHGYTLRDHPKNAPAVRARDRHEGFGHYTTDLMDDIPDGDVCCGFCCNVCDWIREFAYIGRKRRKP